MLEVAALSREEPKDILLCLILSHLDLIERLTWGNYVMDREDAEERRERLGRVLEES